MSLKIDLSGDVRKGDPRDALTGMPLMIADIIKFIIELGVYGFAFSCAGWTFAVLWKLGIWGSILAFPAGFLALILGFYAALVILRIIFVRAVPEGTYDLQSRQALRWILNQSLLLLVQRSFLRGLIFELAPQRYLFYRMLGAKLHHSTLFGANTVLTDPWATEIGPRAVIGAESFITAHAVEGRRITVRRVAIGADSTIGMRSVIMPGATIGEGAIIAAGAVLTKDAIVADGEIWGGVPAKRIREARASRTA